MGDVFEGVRGPFRSGDPNLARALARRGRVAYCVIEAAREPPRPATRRDLRAASRAAPACARARFSTPPTPFSANA